MEVHETFVLTGTSVSGGYSERKETRRKPTAKNIFPWFCRGGGNASISQRSNHVKSTMCSYQGQVGLLSTDNFLPLFKRMVHVNAWQKQKRQIVPLSLYSIMRRLGGRCVLSEWLSKSFHIRSVPRCSKSVLMCTQGCSELVPMGKIMNPSAGRFGFCR